jgi:NADPH-dependent curcumin reductase CurA
LTLSTDKHIVPKNTGTMSRENTTYYLAERPKADIVKGQTFKAKKEPAPTADQLKDGEVLVESLYLSLDPAMRGWLNGTLRLRIFLYSST